ncbi:MAG: hypothetical protein Q9179_006899, partial [Wetmoreana sp. 5 TL-2023]
MYRMGAPGPLRALPLQTDFTNGRTPARQAYEAVKAGIITSLTNAHISGWTLNLVKQSTLGDTPNDEDYTILIHTHKQDGWFRAVNSILEVLQHNNVSGLRIEIMDNRAVQRFWGPDVGPHFMNAWPALEMQLIGLLGLGDQWNTFNIFNRGHKKEESLPTVTIGLTRKADVEWQTMIYEKIQDLLQRFPTSPEMVYVRSSLQGDSQAVPQQTDAFARLVPMGSGIGIRDKSGTLGGYVTVEYLGFNYMMALTTHRAITNDGMTD